MEVTQHLLHTLCLWAAESVVKENNAYIHRGAAEDIKYKYKLGHSTCDSKGIYPELLCFCSQQWKSEDITLTQNAKNMSALGFVDIHL